MFIMLSLSYLFNFFLFYIVQYKINKILLRIKKFTIFIIEYENEIFVIIIRISYYAKCCSMST